MSASADPRQAERVAELYRQVRATVDRVRPLHDSHAQLKNSGNGEKADALWNVMSADEREEVAHFAQYVQALEELRQGRIPPLSTLPAGLQKHQLGGPVGAAPKVGATVVVRTQQSKKHRHGGRGRIVSAPPEEVAAGSEPAHAEEEEEAQDDVQEQEDEAEEEEEEEITIDITSLKSAEDAANALFTLFTADARERLLILFIEQHMSTESTATSDAAEAEAKLQETDNLKKRIVSGALKKPSKAQMTEVERIPALRKQANNARKRVEREELQLRARVLELLDALEASSSSSSSSTSEASLEAAEAADDATALAPSAGVVADKAHDAQEPLVDDVAPSSAPPPSEPAETARDVSPHPSTDALATPADPTPEEGENEDAHAACATVEQAPTPAQSDHVEATDKEEVEAEVEAEVAEDEEKSAEDVSRAATPAAPVSSAVTGLSEGNQWHTLVYTADGFTMDTFRSLVRHPAKTAAEDAADAEEEKAEKEAEAEAEEKVEEEAVVNVAAAVVPPVPRYAEDRQLHYLRHHLGSADRARHDEPASSRASASADADQSDNASDISDESSRSSSRSRSGAGDGKGGKTAPRMATVLVDKASPSLQACLAREWTAIHAAPLAGVLVRRASTTVWHVCVSPMDGPLSGTALHLTVRFAATYPFTCPKVRLDVPVPHPALMVSAAGEANTLFLTFTDPVSGAATGWRPDFGVRTVLQAVQHMFDASPFAAMRAALGEAAFAAQVREVRTQMAQCLRTCPCCAASARAEYINGPLLTAGPAPATEPAAPDSTTAEAEAPVEGRRPPLHLAGASGKDGTAGEEAADGWLPPGPWQQCWAHLLVTGPHTRRGGLTLRVQSRGRSLPARPTESHAAVRVCEVSRASAWSEAGGQSSAGPTAVSAWAATLRHPSATSADAPLFTWAAEPEAWRSTTRPRASPSTVKPKKKKDGTTSRKADAAEAETEESVCELCVVLVEDDNADAKDDDQAPGVVRVRLPSIATEGPDAAPERFFAIVLEAAAGQSLAFHVSYGMPAVSACACAPPSSADASAEQSLCTTWPATAFYLDPHTTAANTAEDPLTTTTGLLVELPYLHTPAAATSGSEASYYIPRQVRFHLRAAHVPLVLSESAYLANRHVILTRRRRRDGTYPPTEDGAPRDDYLASATEDVLRRALNLDDTPASPAAAAETSKYFWGLRTVFIPLTRSWGRDDFGRTHALDRLKRTAIQLYRHPAASVAYHPPFHPLQVLHLLSLVLHHVLVQSTTSASSAAAAAAANEVSSSGGALYTRLGEELERTALDLAADSPAFLRLCVSLVDAHVHIAAETAHAVPHRPLFLRAPFMPFPSAALTTVPAPTTTTADASAGALAIESEDTDHTEPALAAEVLSEAARRVGEVDTAHYLAQEATMEAVALYVAATVVVGSAMAPPVAAAGLAQSEQTQHLTRTQACAAYLLDTLAPTPARTKPDATGTYVYTGATPDAACAQALSTLRYKRTIPEL